MSLSCSPTMMVAAVAVPIVVVLLLYFFKPSFVQKKEGGKLARDKSKIFMWTVGITLVLWGAMYGITYAGYGGSSVVCTA